MFEVVAYFHGPKTAWSKKVDASEIIARIPIPWLWAARLRATSFLKDIDRARVGVLITKDGELYEHFEAQSSAPNSPDIEPSLLEELDRRDERLKSDIIRGIRRRKYTL